MRWRRAAMFARERLILKLANSHATYNLRASHRTLSYLQITIHLHISRHTTALSICFECDFADNI